MYLPVQPTIAVVTQGLYWRRARNPTSWYPEYRSGKSTLSRDQVRQARLNKGRSGSFHDTLQLNEAEPGLGGEKPLKSWAPTVSHSFVKGTDEIYYPTCQGVFRCRCQRSLGGTKSLSDVMTGSDLSTYHNNALNRYRVCPRL